MTASLPALLAERAAVKPFAPWLFSAVGIDWRWRSWQEVADQVARGADRLRAWKRAAPGRDACHLAVTPTADAVAASLALQMAGIDIILDPPDVNPAASAAGVNTELDDPPAMPDCRDQLDIYQPEQLTAPADDLVGGWRAGGRRWSQAEMMAEATRLADQIGGPASGRSIGFLGVGPGAVAAQRWLAWSLIVDAALVLEPDAEAFVGSLRWSRPTSLLASLDEVESLKGIEPPQQCWRLQTIITASNGADIGPSDDSAWATRVMSMDDEERSI